MKRLFLVASFTLMLVLNINLEARSQRGNTHSNAPTSVERDHGRDRALDVGSKGKKEGLHKTSKKGGKDKDKDKAKDKDKDKNEVSKKK